jgi:DNA-binding transcriptional MerR regulator
MTEGTQVTRLTVGQVAEQLTVTVRTLHHYDEIGLLRPSERTPAGYRLYTDEDVVRLQHIVVYRRLGFAPEEIGLLLGHPESVEEHLRRQRAAVSARLDEMRDLVAAIDRALEKEASGMKLTRQERKELFGDGYSDEYAAEAEQRWGDSEAWKQSRRRTSEYSKEDWTEITAESESVGNAFVQAKRAGLAATSPAAMDAAEAHRRHIHARFYDVSHEFHRNLADMYVADPRFTKTYDDQEPGLARYVRDAIHANADRHDGSAER